MKHYYIYWYKPIKKYCLYYVNRNTCEYAIIKVFSCKTSAVIFGLTHNLTVHND